MNRALLTLTGALLGASPAVAVDFEKEIKPILKEHCYSCHSEEKKKEKAGYVFDNLTRLGKDIGAGRVIEPGRPFESHFYVVISDTSHSNAMPPDGPMPEEQIKKLREWIAKGAMLDPNAPKPVFKKDLPPILKWTNAEGKSIKAGFDRLEDESVVLKMPTGEFVKYPLSKLSAESQKLARDCAAP